MTVFVTQIAIGQINTSLQVGDAVYYHPSNLIMNMGGFSSTDGSTVEIFGVVDGVDVVNNTFNVRWDDNIGSAPGAGDYLMFVKDQQVNTSSLVGYYAEATFKNNSKKKVELFAVSANVVQSSNK
jgi:hypothetical protein